MPTGILKYIYRGLVVFILPVTCISAGTYDVRDFGAAGDGATLDTKSIQRAIDAAGEKGGTVMIPAGIYLTGSLEMRSHVTLHLEAGATLLGSTDIKDYQEYKPSLPSYNDLFLRHSLLYGENLENISITGEGTIDGQGGAFRITTNKKPDRYKNRPYVIRFVACKDVRVEGIKMQNSAMWMQHYFACENVRIRGINVYNHCNKNNDMIDIDGCKNVIVSDCFGDTDDDALTIKSTSNLISENITVTNCVLSSHCNAIKLGTESHGGFKNITISNIIIKPSSNPTNIYGFPAGISGITLGMVDGGELDGVLITNVRIDGPRVPIYMRLGDRGRVYQEGMPRPGVGIFRNVVVSDILATGADTTGCSITGLPGYPVENITLSNIRIEFGGGGPDLSTGHGVPELADHYPESTKFGALPSYGFFIRHARGIIISDVEVRFKEKDVRCAMICADVENIEIDRFRARCTENGNPMISLQDVQKTYINGCRPLEPVTVFLEIRGAKTKGIYLSNNVPIGVSNLLHISPEVNPEEVHIQNNPE